MYYLLIDIHHFSQLSIIEPELAGDIFNSTRELCGKWNMTLLEKSSYFIYAHNSLRPDEYDPLLKVIFALKEMLASYREEIPGYSLILEAINAEPQALLASLNLKVRDRSGLYLGLNAAKIMASLLSGKSVKGLWKIEGQKQNNSLDTAGQFILQKHFFEKLLASMTPWINESSEPGEIHIGGEEINGLHLVGDSIIQQLTDSEAQGKLIYAAMNEKDNLFYAIARSINVKDLRWVEKELSQLELSIWNEKKVALWNHYPSINKSLPTFATEKPESDMLIIMQIYLKAYSIWSYSRGSLPVIIFYFNRKLSKTEQWFLRLLMREGQKNLGLFWFFIAPPDKLPTSPIALKRISVNLNDYSSMEIRELCKRQNFSDNDPEYVEKSTEGKGFALYHFLHNSDTFTQARSNQLKYNSGESMGPSQEIVQKSLYLLDVEARELLYMLALIGNYVDKEQLFAFFESRGRPRMRIIELYKELYVKGYLLCEQTHSVAFKTEIARLHLNFANTGLIQDSINFLLNPDNALRLQPGLVEFVTKNSKYPSYLPVVYRYLQMMIDSRQYQRVEKEKVCLNPTHLDVLDLINAQLSLEFGTFKEEMIPVNFTGDDYWKGEWLIVQTIFYIKGKRFEDAIQSCKSAIILFQNVNEYGLARANNIFGYLHHYSGKYQDALHYFSITIRNRKDKGIYNLIAAEFMSSLCNFVQGKYSTVKKTLKGDDGLLNRLLKHGNHGWSRAVAFLMARTHFALGEYEESQAVLGRQLNSFREEGEQQIHELFYAWIARCFMHQGKFKAGMKIIDHLRPTLELSLFKAEGHILKNEFDEALSVLQNPGKDAEPAYPFNPLFSWQNGFSWVENLLAKNMDDDNVLENLKHGMIAYAMGNSDYMADSIEKFHWLIREKKIPPSDPHLSTILYWYTQILEKSQQQKSEDLLTILALAVKALQERSSNIEEPADKRSFLKNVAWNSKLFNSAKKYNLLLWE